MGFRACVRTLHFEGDGFEAAEKAALHEGHGFSRAVDCSDLDGFSRRGTAFRCRFRATEHEECQRRAPQGLKPSSIRFCNGTAEPVPFVESSFFRILKAVPFKVLCSHTRSLAPEGISCACLSSPQRLKPTYGDC